MKNKQIIIFLIFSPLTNLVNNLVHPVTPAYVKMMNMPDYMFGVLFASMALASFFSSPFWGDMSDRIGRVSVMQICFLGYALGQLGFSTIRIPLVIIFCRLFAGAFASGYLVAALAYITDISTEKTRAKYLSLYAALFTLTTPLGYFIGGFIGNNNIFYSFYTQLFFLFLIVLTIKIILPESLLKENMRKEKFNLKNSLKIIDIQKSKAILTLPLIIFFIGVVLTEFSRVGFTNSFNYYMKDVLNLNPSRIGSIMGGIGFAGLFANLVINPFIIKRFNTRKLLPLLILLDSIAGIFLVIYNNDITFFIAIAFIFATINAIYVPIQQALFTQGQKENYGLLAGYFNSSKSLGMVTGALFTGIAYEFNSLYPFILISMILFIGCSLYFYNYHQYKKL